jgi:hypothetical protein
VRHHALLLRAFPRAWRERYATEVLRLLAEDPSGRWQGFDLVRAGVAERWHGLVVFFARRRRVAAAWDLQAGGLGLVGSLAVPLVLAVVVGVSLVARGTSEVPAGPQVAVGHVVWRGTPVRGVHLSPVWIPRARTAVQSVAVRLPDGSVTHVAAPGRIRASAVRSQFLAALRRHQVGVSGVRGTPVSRSGVSGIPARPAGVRWSLPASGLSNRT